MITLSTVSILLAAHLIKQSQEKKSQEKEKLIKEKEVLPLLKKMDSLEINSSKSFYLKNCYQLHDRKWHE